MNKVSWIMGLVATAVVIASAVIQFARADFMGSLQGLFASLAAVGLAWTFLRLWGDAKAHPKADATKAERVSLLMLSVSGALFALALLLGSFSHF